MIIWQADFYRRPLQDPEGNPVWELVVCSPEQNFKTHVFCSQADAHSKWLTEKVRAIAHQVNHYPNQIHVFRPQALNLVETACQTLNITVIPTRHMPDLKQYLQERAQQYRQLDYYTGEPYDPVKLEQFPPLPLPEHLWGEQWRFAAIAAGDIQLFVGDRPIPILEMPERLLPVNLKLPSTVSVPGIVIDGGRQSMRLARWLQEVHPVALRYVKGEPDGLILDAGLVDRWIIATVSDPAISAAAQTYQQRLQQTQGLHFLLVQPDDSGMTYSGFWLLSTDATELTTPRP